MNDYLTVPLTEVAEMAERAYRRGYQQGYTQATNGVTLRVDLWTWRYQTPAHKSVCPDTGHEMPGLDALGRLKCEEHRRLQQIEDARALARHDPIDQLWKSIEWADSDPVPARPHLQLVKSTRPDDPR